MILAKDTKQGEERGGEEGCQDSFKVVNDPDTGIDARPAGADGWPGEGKVVTVCSPSATKVSLDMAARSQ